MSAYWLRTETQRLSCEKIVMAAWVMHYSVPVVFVIDQGGELEAEFIAMCEEFHTDTKIAGSHAPWQHGFAERHGGILGEIFEKITEAGMPLGCRKLELSFTERSEYCQGSGWGVADPLF